MKVEAVPGWLRSRVAVVRLALSLGAFVAGCAADSPADEGEIEVHRDNLTTPVYQINCGGGAVSPFRADQYSNGGETWSDGTNVSTTGVANAAPAAVYRSERYGDFSYTFRSLTPGARYTVRMHFAETKFTAAGKRRFNVLINNASALSNVDIFALAGANKALVREVDATATSTGQIVVRGSSIVDNAKFCGLEILSNSGSPTSDAGSPTSDAGAPTSDAGAPTSDAGSPTSDAGSPTSDAGSPTNQAPTVTTPASATPSPVTASSTALSVRGSDDGGEASLTYTWATSGTPAAAVSFSPNGTNAAKNATATFTKAGSYALVVTLRDAAGRTATSNVNVVVNATVTSISVTPTSAQVAPGGSQAFQASARDQFGAALSSQPAVSWSVSGGGSINASGVFTAGSTGGGPFTVRAANGAVSGSANVTVTSAPAAVTYSTNFDTPQFPLSEGGVWRNLGLDWTQVRVANGLAHGTQSGYDGFDDSYAYLSGFPPNQTASATIHLEANVNADYAEVEILLRWSDSAHRSIGYECNLAFDGSYAEIIRWPGPSGADKDEYTYLASEFVPMGVHDGDVFSARVVGNRITSYLNGRVLVTATDDAITSGNPGIGFFWEGGPGSPKFSFTNFSASSL